MDHIKYFDTNVLADDLGVGFASLLGETKFERSDHPSGLLTDEAIARLLLPADPTKFSQEEATRKISSLIYELTLKMEDQAAQLYPRIISPPKAPEQMSEAVQRFATRVWEGHELYKPFIGTRGPMGERYELIINCIYSTVSIPIKGVERMCFIYSVSTCVWRVQTSLFESLRNLFGFTNKKGKLEGRTFVRILERYHTGAKELP
ncbi:hypothetical protein D3C71_77150 [compost metagenome]